MAVWICIYFKQIKKLISTLVREFNDEEKEIFCDFNLFGRNAILWKHFDCTEMCVWLTDHCFNVTMSQLLSSESSTLRLRA